MIKHVIKLAGTDIERAIADYVRREFSISGAVTVELDGSGLFSEKTGGRVMMERGQARTEEVEQAPTSEVREWTNYFPFGNPFDPESKFKERLMNARLNDPFSRKWRGNMPWRPTTWEYRTKDGHIATVYWYYDTTLKQHCYGITIHTKYGDVSSKPKRGPLQPPTELGPGIQAWAEKRIEYCKVSYTRALKKAKKQNPNTP